MNANYELLQFYVYKKIIKKKDVENILSECERLGISARDYLLTKEYTTETTELEALAEYYCMPCIELEMLDIDKTLFDKFSFEFMKTNKIIPVSFDKNGTLLVAVGKPLDTATLSSMSIAFSAPIECILTPPSA